MYVRCFRHAFCIGSNEKLCNICRTLCKFHYSGTNLTKGDIELNTPFKSLIMYGCWPTDTLSTGGSTDDNIDLFSAMVLYWRPLAYKSEKNLATSTRDAQ